MMTEEPTNEGLAIAQAQSTFPDAAQRVFRYAWAGIITEDEEKTAMEELRRMNHPSCLVPVTDQRFWTP